LIEISILPKNKNNRCGHFGSSGIGAAQKPEYLLLWIFLQFWGNLSWLHDEFEDAQPFWRPEQRWPLDL
jgi:hypothetical protein